MCVQGFLSYIWLLYYVYVLSYGTTTDKFVLDIWSVWCVFDEWQTDSINWCCKRVKGREREREWKLMTMEPVSMISDAYNVGIHDCAICNRRFCFFRFVFLPIHRTFQLNIPLEKVENRSHFLIVAFFYNINRLVVLTLTTVPFMPCK